MIDFTNCEELINNYLGSEKKRRIRYNREIYLLKFPDPIRERNNRLFYANNQFSEYIGCHIFKELGIPVQDTQLGIYHEENKDKICVACRDFVNDGLQLYEFAKVANSVTGSPKKFATRIEDVYEVVEKTDLIKDKQAILDGFWDIFVVDCLIGNPDRHLDNWGVVQNEKKEVRISPVYDCGSCLFPFLTEEEVEKLIQNPIELKNISIHLKSAYKLKDKSIFYRNIGEIDNIDFKNALYRVGNKINLDNIEMFIKKIPYLKDTYKECYIESIRIRYDTILKKQIQQITLEKEKTLPKFSIGNK